MKTIRETADEYVEKMTKNIADLDTVSTEMVLEDRSGVDKDGIEFTYKVLVKDDVEYRVPASVIKQLKVLLEDKPDMTEFKVKKSGTGMATEYTVIGL